MSARWDEDRCVWVIHTDDGDVDCMVVNGHLTPITFISCVNGVVSFMVEYPVHPAIEKGSKFTVSPLDENGERK